MLDRGKSELFSDLSSTDFGISVEDLLELNILPEVELIAGEGGNKNIIRAVTVMEAPDFIDWVKKDEFLLTTAYAIANKPDALHDIIPALANKGLAALGIKPGRFIDSIPSEMLELANKLNFPLIKIPHHISFSELIMPISFAISERQIRYLKLAEKMHNILIKAASEVEGLQYLGEKLYELVNNPLSIRVPNLNTAIYIPKKEFVQNLENSKKVLPAASDDYESVTDDSVSVFSRKLIEWQGKQIYETHFPIVAGAEELGLLTVWEINPLSKLAVAALERSISIAAYEIMKSYAMLAVESKYKNIIVDQLISYDEHSHEQLKEHAKVFGWNLEPPFCVIVIEVENSTDPKKETSYVNEMQHMLCNLINKVSAEFVVADMVNSIVVIASKSLVESEHILKENIENIRKALQTSVKRINFRIGVGRIYSAIDELASSYQEAKKAIKVNKQLRKTNDIFYFEDLGLWRILSLIQSRDEVNAFVKDTLGNILEYDKKYNTSFMETLKVYIETGLSIKQTADHFNVHYNTISYRIDRINHLFNLNLQDQQQRLSIEIALKFLFN